MSIYLAIDPRNVELLMRTIKEEEVDLSEYEDSTDAVRQVGRFLDEVYMPKSIHSSLGYLAPAEFEQQWQPVQGPLLPGSQPPACEMMERRGSL